MPRRDAGIRGRVTTGRLCCVGGRDSLDQHGLDFCGDLRAVRVIGEIVWGWLSDQLAGGDACGPWLVGWLSSSRPRAEAIA